MLKTHTNTHTHTNTNTQPQPRTHTKAHTNTHTHKDTHKHTNTQTHTCLHIHTRTHTCTHTRTGTHTNTHAHTHTHTRANTHTNKLMIEGNFDLEPGKFLQQVHCTLILHTHQETKLTLTCNASNYYLRTISLLQTIEFNAWRVANGGRKPKKLDPNYKIMHRWKTDYKKLQETTKKAGEQLPAWVQELNKLPVSFGINDTYILALF